MKVNFLKRLESSVKSFEITMERTIDKIEGLEQKIHNFQAARPARILSQTSSNSIFGDPGEDEELEEAQLVGGKLKYRLEHLELDRGRTGSRI